MWLQSRPHGCERDLERAGHGIGPYDTVIAGHALARNIELITNNTREFTRVKTLRLLDWRAGEKTMKRAN